MVAEHRRWFLLSFLLLAIAGAGCAAPPVPEQVKTKSSRARAGDVMQTMDVKEIPGSREALSDRGTAAPSGVKSSSDGPVLSGQETAPSRGASTRPGTSSSTRPSNGTTNRDDDDDAEDLPDEDDDADEEFDVALTN